MQMEKKCKSTDLKHLYFNFDGKKMKIFSKKIYLVFLTECTISLIHLCQHFFFLYFKSVWTADIFFLKVFISIALLIYFQIDFVKLF